MAASSPVRLSGGRLPKSLNPTNPSPGASGRNVVGTCGEAAAGCVGTAGGPWLVAPDRADGGVAAAGGGCPGRAPRQRAPRRCGAFAGAGRTGHAAWAAGSRSKHVVAWALGVTWSVKHKHHYPFRR